MIEYHRLKNNQPEENQWEEEQRRNQTERDDEDEDEEDHLIIDQHSLNGNKKYNKQKQHPLLPTPATYYYSNSKLKSKTSVTISLIAISSAFIAIALFIWSSRPTRHTTLQSDSTPLVNLSDFPNHLQRISFDDALSPQNSPKRHSISWLDEAGDGVYSEINDRGIILNDLNSNSSKILVPSDQLVDPFGNSIRAESFTVSSDLRYVLVATNSMRQWRHSTFATYLIYDTLLKTVVSLGPDIPSSNRPMVSIAKWSPTGHAIAYVVQNDIYLITSPTQVDKPIRLTTSGTATIFNGICDWVYEEEVFSSSEALWWSPDSTKLVWLSLDESHVPIYELDIFNPSDRIGKSIPYPNKLGMKYPKPGFNNPIVSVELFDLASFQLSQDPLNPDPTINPGQFTTQLKLPSEFNDDDRIVMEVAWIAGNQLIIRYTNRIATLERTGYFDLSYFHPTRTISASQLITYGKVVMDIDFVQFDGGWAEPGQFIKPVKLNSNQNRHDLAPGYLDVRINEEGFRHVAYFSPPDSNRPIFLSHGRWEVDGSILAVDYQRNLIYFLAANPSMERHLYSVNLPTRTELRSLKSLSKSSSSLLSNQSLKKTKPITKGIGYYSASFSALGGFYLLNYNGPHTPWQKILKVNDTTFDHTVENNSGLANSLKKYALPEVHYTSLNNSIGQEMNVQEIRPFRMDLSGNVKYPVLFKVYGGPNSQTASKNFQVDWSYFLASSLEYIIVYVDGRGTGFKGRKFRVGVRNQLGMLESLDVSTAAQFYAGLKYVDADRIGIWGWSYGGYLTCKTVESYSQDFSMALAVAPVTDWKFYDSIYTERYMSTPQLNQKGYAASAIKHMKGFGNLSFSLAHGSADDNVHFLNSANLLDRLTGNGIHGFQFRMFPDSDHSISTRGAYRELLVWMTDFLLDRWGHGLSPDKNLNNRHHPLQDKKAFDLAGLYSP